MKENKKTADETTGRDQRTAERGRIDDEPAPKAFDDERLFLVCSSEMLRTCAPRCALNGSGGAVEAAIAG